MLEQILERFGSNRLGDAPDRFPTSEQHTNLLLTVFWVVEYIPNVSEAPPAVDSAESCCSESVGQSDSLTSGPWRPLRPPPYYHLRPPFATTAAFTASHMHQDIYRMSLVHILRLFSPTRPPTRRPRRRSDRVDRPQSPLARAKHHDAGPRRTSE